MAAIPVLFEELMPLIDALNDKASALGLQTLVILQDAEDVYLHTNGMTNDDALDALYENPIPDANAPDAGAVTDVEIEL